LVIGWGVAEDKEKAFPWYLKAAEEGHAEAQFYVGLCYSKGEGVLQDSDKSFQWYMKAAEQGYPQAQFNVGYCYEYANGVMQDQDKALEWFVRAANKGHPRAKNFVKEQTLNAKFEKAGRDVQTLLSKPDNDTLLKLFAFFKQGSVGDVTGNRPGFIDFKGRAKFDAWYKLRGTPQGTAKQEYINLVEKLK